MQTFAKSALQREIALAEWLVAESEKKVVGGNISLLHDYSSYKFMLDSLRRIEKEMQRDELPMSGCPF